MSLTITRKYDAVLFDMDGTLLDSHLVIERIMRLWARKHSLDAEKVLAVCTGRRAIDTVREFALEGMDCEAEAAFISNLEISDVEGIYAIPGANNLIGQLGDENWAVVTSAGRDLAERRFKAAGLKLPEIMVTADDVENGKPNPDGYQLAAKRLGVNPNNCLVFEDAIAGIDAGLNAGCDVIGIKYANPQIPMEKCPVINDYSELKFDIAPGRTG